jgi:lipoprotein-anchoring transpeptidase ErfK/SrfK
MTTSKFRRRTRMRHSSIVSLAILAIGVLAVGTMAASPASAQALSYANDAPTMAWPSLDNRVQAPQDQTAPVPQRDTDVLPPALRRQVVDYAGSEAPGTIVIDTTHTVLYYVLSDHRAMRYGVGVGREGFTWSGTEIVSRKAEWPDWIPPSEMIARQPYLPRFVAGGPGNPLGARAMYLGESKYRIHGTNDPTTIGKFVSSGCIRLTNTDVQDLYSRVSVGTKVIVLPKGASARATPVSSRVSERKTAPRPLAAANLNGSGIY